MTEKKEIGKEISELCLDKLTFANLEFIMRCSGIRKYCQLHYYHQYNPNKKLHLAESSLLLIEDVEIRSLEWPN